MVTWVAFCLWAQAAENFVFFYLAFRVGAVRVLVPHSRLRASLYLSLLGFIFPVCPFLKKEVFDSKVPDIKIQGL